MQNRHSEGGKKVPTPEHGCLGLAGLSPSLLRLPSHLLLSKQLILLRGLLPALYLLI